MKTEITTIDNIIENENNYTLTRKELAYDITTDELLSEKQSSITIPKEHATSDTLYNLLALPQDMTKDLKQLEQYFKDTKIGFDNEDVKSILAVENMIFTGNPKGKKVYDTLDYLSARELNMDATQDWEFEMLNAYLMVLALQYDLLS